MMRALLTISLLLSSIAGCSGQSAQPHSRFVAYSLGEAEARAQSGRRDRELQTLGGITRVAGMVYDRQRRDVILVGLAAPELPELHLDDLVVALRARLCYGEWPLVSIDPLPDTDRTKLQQVRFDGHLENTSFGRDFLDCDVLLKLYSLQMLKEVSQVRPYNLLVEDSVRGTVERAGAKVLSARWRSAEDGAAINREHEGMTVSSAHCYQARFWFYVLEPYVYAYKGDVFCIKELRLALKSEGGPLDGPTVDDGPRALFAQGWTEHFAQMSQEYPALRKLKSLYDLVAVAEAVSSLGGRTQLEYLLHDYAVEAVATARSYRLEERYGLFERSDGLRHLVRVSGGIELRTEVKFLNAGDVTQLRSIVIGSRPSGGALTWPLPLDGWKAPNARDLPEPGRGAAEDPGQDAPTGSRRAGCSILFQSLLVDPKGLAEDDTRKRFSGFPPGPPPPPPLGGVSMLMTVEDDSFGPATDGADSMRTTVLRARPSTDSLSWSPQKEEDSDADRKR